MGQRRTGSRVSAFRSCRQRANQPMVAAAAGGVQSDRRLRAGRDRRRAGAGRALPHSPAASLRRRRHHRKRARVLRLHHLRLLCDPDRARLLPVPQRLRQPDAVAGDLRGRLRHPSDRWRDHRGLLRPGGPAAGDDAELHDDGRGDHRAGDHPALRQDRRRRADPGHPRAHAAGLLAGRRGRTDNGLSARSGAAEGARPGRLLAGGEPGHRRDAGRPGGRGAFAGHAAGGAGRLRLADRLPAGRGHLALRALDPPRPSGDAARARAGSGGVRRS